MWYTYIIKSQTKRWYYVGSTNDIFRRLKEHNSGKVSSTKSYLPFVVIRQFEFESEKEARLYERKLKDCRKEKEAIIRDFENRV